MDEIIISAKPKPYGVMPYTITIHPSSSPLSGRRLINVIGNSFWNITNVYLSASDPSILNNQITFFDPFSACVKLSANNLGFSAIKVLDYYVLSDKFITIDPPIYFSNSGFVDVIVENEAGYGLLSRDSRVPFLSSYKGAEDIQLPCVSGIKLILK